MRSDGYTKRRPAEVSCRPSRTEVSDVPIFEGIGHLPRDHFNIGMSPKLELPHCTPYAEE